MNESTWNKDVHFKDIEDRTSADGIDVSSYHAPLSITPAYAWQNWFKGECYENEDLDEEVHWEEPEVLLRCEDPSEGRTIGKLYICHHCSFEWDDFSILKSHIKTVHLPFFKKEMTVETELLDPREKAKSCESDPAESLKKELPNENVKDTSASFNPPSAPLADSTCINHTGKKKRKKCVECPHCDFRCAKPKTLSKHILLKHKDAKPHECTFCQFSSFYPKVLKRHIRSKHPFVKPYTCSQCVYTSYEESDLKVHIINEHTDKLLHNCPHCGYVSSQCSALMAHIKGKHPAENLSQCPHCNKRTFDSLYTEELKTIERNVLPNCNNLNSSEMLKPPRAPSKIHQCPECEYNTPQLAHLKRHIISNHTFERPYQCLHCAYSTARSDHLRKHVINKHAHENTFHCTHCTFTSPHATDLKLHIKLTHADSDSAFISFNCYINTLQQAIDKCYKCPQCTYITQRQDNLKRHLITQHTATKCFQCAFCCFQTYRFDKLQNHVKARHSSINFLNSQFGSVQQLYTSQISPETTLSIQ